MYLDFAFHRQYDLEFNKNGLYNPTIIGKLKWFS